MIDLLLIIAAMIGIGAAAFLVARSPTFWIGFGKEVFKAFLPILLKRKSPEEEKKWRERVLRGESGRVDKFGREKSD